MSHLRESNLLAKVFIDYLEITDRNLSRKETNSKYRYSGMIPTAEMEAIARNPRNDKMVL